MRSLRVEPGAVARHAPDLACHRQRHPDSFYRGNSNGVLKVKKFAACSFIATIFVASTLLSPFSAATSASAATTVNKGIYKPTSIGIGTNINISTPDPGVATYVGRDMYIGGKPNDPRTLDANNAPTGSYELHPKTWTA